MTPAASSGAWPKGRYRDLFALNGAAMRYWHECLLATPSAMEFLAGRGFADPEGVARRFGIGYAPTRDDARRPFVAQAMSKPKGLGAASQEEMQLMLRTASLAKGGTMDEDGPFRDVFYGRLIFPIAITGSLDRLWDEKTRIAGFGGRLVPRPTRKGVEPPKWLNSPDSPIFRKRSLLYGAPWSRNAMASERRAIMLEGYLDLVQLWEAGFRSVVASLGTSVTEDHLALLPAPRRAGSIMRLYLASDDDVAGRRAAYRAAGMARVRHPDLEVYMALPEGGLDPDDFILQRGAAAFEGLLQEAPTPLQRMVRDLPTPDSTLMALTDLLRMMKGWASPCDEVGMVEATDLSAWIRRHAGAHLPPWRLREIIGTGEVDVARTLESLGLAPGRTVSSGR
jgi:DNA primase